MAGKRFSKSLFEKNDEEAKNAVEFLKDHFGVDEFQDGETRYKIDRKGYRNGNHCLNVEVEIKQHWKDGQEPFPYDEINLPSRKGKYFDLELPTYFVIFSADCKGAVIFSDTVAKNSEMKEVPNRYVPKGEMFYKIPLKKAALMRFNQ
tara:strand:- start:1263 stop:1706 length:444 start_codon:yes stop_codon:yes gene_type:complete